MMLNFEIDLEVALMQLNSFAQNFALPWWNANLVTSPSHVLIGA